MKKAKKLLTLVECVPFGLSSGEKKVCKSKKEITKFKKHMCKQYGRCEFRETQVKP